MHYYTQKSFLSLPTGNNAFSYKEREELLGRSPMLVIPKLSEVKSVEEVCLGNDIVFEEIEEGVLRSCTGLAGLYLFQYGQRNIPVYVMDNHNHALYCWTRERLLQQWSTPATLYHIDQHTDMRDPEVYLDPLDLNDMEKVAVYTNEILNVGNFIIPAQKVGLIDQIVMMDKSQAFVEVPSVSKAQPNIVDIDLDIFTKELEFYGFEKIIEVTKSLMTQASVITIATSPYFIEQERALLFLRKLFS